MSMAMAWLHIIIGSARESLLDTNTLPPQTLPSRPVLGQTTGYMICSISKLTRLKALSHLTLIVLFASLFSCTQSHEAQTGNTVPAKKDSKTPESGIQAIKKAGVLRALILQPNDTSLPREGSSIQIDKSRIEAFAHSLGVHVEFIPMSSVEQLIDALVKSQADVIATALPSMSPKDGMLISKPVKYEKQILVANRSHRKRLKKYRALRKYKLIRSAYLTDALLAKLNKRARKPIEVIEPQNAQDTDEILYSIGSSKKRLATVVLTHNLNDYLLYRDDVSVAKSLGRVSMSLAFRADLQDLVEVADDFFAEYAMTPHLRKRFGGDLKDIKKRHVIRVALLNNSVSYFIYRGQQVGFQFDLAELLSMRLGVRLEVVIPERPGKLFDLLLENRADLAFVTPTLNNALFDKCGYSLPIDHADQILVQPASEPAITTLDELKGRTIHVRRSSQYYSTLVQLQKTVPDLHVVPASENDETEDLIDKVGRGEIPLTVANSALLKVELTYRDDVQGTLVLSRARPLVFAVRKESRQLLDRLNRFVLEDCSGPKFQALLHKYFSRDKHMTQVRTQTLAKSGAISPYDDMVKKIAREYGLDWRLVLAQMYQESRFDPNAKSWAGAEGLLQVMPQTAKQLDLKNPFDPEQNIRAGVSYLMQLLKRFDKTLPFRQRIRFALASYNAGIGHVQDAIRLAKTMGKDPKVWFGNVERAMLLLEKPRYYRRARNGYCRGSEPVTYVSKIQDKYDAYTSLVPVVAGK